MPITERLEAWLRAAPKPWYLGQLAILSGYELRHRDDLGVGPGDLTTILDLPALREIVKSDAHGGYRPLRGAPTLRSGWRMDDLNLTALAEALDLVYPAALAFWDEKEAGTLRVTGFTGTARRQTGMYRITQVISSSQLERTVLETCEKGCLRRRLWEPASPILPNASEIPLLCPEACNFFVAHARERIVKEREKNAQG